MSSPDAALSNSEIAELLAVHAETAKQPLQKALRRASRRAFLWPEEAAQLVREHRSLEELSAVGPSLSKLIGRWLEHPPDVPPPPEIRRNFFTITEARALLARNRSWLPSLKGDLQMHSLWSDGTASVAEMAAAGADRGYQYIAITDHSKGLKIANGINEPQLQDQAREIAELNQAAASAGTRIRVLHSIELNLDPLGNGDMDESALAQLDLVLGSFHSALRRKEDQTERYLAALRNPSVHILGHPRGRIYNYRLGLAAEWSRVFDAAAQLDKAIEIDAYPDRQDVSVDLLKLARKAGCRVSLGTDAHGPSQLAFIELALCSAITAGLPRERILNFMEADQLLEWAASLERR
jgi:histidinol phosphatase-like PHP family hydrolase